MYALSSISLRGRDLSIVWCVGSPHQLTVMIHNGFPVLALFVLPHVCDILEVA